MYKKRAGTSGIRGQLYETKLISLLLFRARHNDIFKEFAIASSVDGIGAFDDICIRAKLKGSDRPVALFIQAKHRKNAVTINSKNELSDYFKSYLKIRRSFKHNNVDPTFEGTFYETACFFVLYTNASGDDSNIIAKGNIINSIDDLMCVPADINSDIQGASKPSYNAKNIDLLSALALKEQAASLAERVANLYYGESDHQNILEDDLMSRYHVILAHKVVDVTDVQPEGYREAIVRESLFDNNEEFITLFRDALAIGVLKKRTVTDERIHAWLRERNSNHLNEVTWLSETIVSSVNYNIKNGMLEFVNKGTPENLKKQLSKLYISKSDVDEAILYAAKKILTSQSFKVPAAFGNKNLILKEDDVTIEERLNNLTSIFHNLAEKRNDNNIYIDESLGKEFLQLNGGIAGAVGNILVLDKNTELMKFTDDCDSLGDVSKNFLAKLKDIIPDLHKLRFEVKIKNFPRLSLKCSEYEKSLAKDFLNKLLFYTNQGDESRIEDVLMKEIEELQCINDNNFRVTSHAIFLAYHDYIQKWWKSPDKGTYLTKQDQIFDITIGKVVKQLLMTSLDAIYRNKVRNIDYTFKESAIRSLELQDPLSSTIIVTNNSAITAAKMAQYFKKKDHVVLDLEYILNLPMYDCNMLCNELQDTNENQILIFVYDNISNCKNWLKIFKNIVKSVEKKVKIIITKQELSVTIQKQFGNAVSLINDSTINLSDMSEKSRRHIFDTARLIFQGKQVPLDTIVDNESMEFIKGDLLNKIRNQEPIVIGNPLSDPNYERIKHLYVNRYLRRTGQEDGKINENLYDIKDDDDILIVTAIPGMGKSTMLTHLSLKTKEDKKKVWIVRINLVDYSREFNTWQKNKTIIDTLETLNFMCHTILREEKIKANTPTFTLRETDNNEVFLNDYEGDQINEFQLKMFLHLYNKQSIVFVFDGFDEICPHYVNEVVKLLKTVRSYPRKQKMWIASRSYNEITAILQREFVKLHEIEYFSNNEVKKFLNKFWDSNLELKKLDSKQLDNVHNFIKSMEDVLSSGTLTKIQNFPLHEIFFNVFNYFINKLRRCYGWDSFNYVLDLSRMRFNGGAVYTNNMYTFLGTPLHLYLVADYFQKKIKDTIRQHEWNLEINTFTIYERFLETKLKTIRFQDKNNMDIYIPDNIHTYDKEKVDFVKKHKILAAYAVFQINTRTIFTAEELTDVENMIEVIKQGGEKSGLIYNVTLNNVPIFVDKTFAEYFAVGHVCDLLKDAICSEKQQTLVHFILNEMFFSYPSNVRYILDSLLLLDDALMGVFKSNGVLIFKLLALQAKRAKGFETSYTNHQISTDLSLNCALSDNLNNFVSLFLSILKTHLNEDNVDDFIDIIRESRVFGIINVDKHKEFVNFALDNVRKLKPSCFNFMFHVRYFHIVTNFLALSNELIMKTLNMVKGVDNASRLMRLYSAVESRNIKKMEAIILLQSKSPSVARNHHSRKRHHTIS